MDEDFSSRDTVQKRKYITDEQVATFITDLRNGLLIDAFVGDEGQSIANAATKLKVEISTLYYKVRKMIDYDLLEMCRVEKRTGRPVKYYRLSAEEFFLPLELSPFHNLEHYLKFQFAPIQELAVKGCATSLEHTTDSHWGISVRQIKELGEMGIGLRADPPQPEVPKSHYIGFRLINLSKKQAQVLAAQFNDMMKAAELLEEEGDVKEPYVMYSVVAPTYKTL